MKRILPVFLGLLLVLPASAQAQTVASTVPSCNYVQTQRDYFACPNGSGAQIAVAAYSGVDYTFSYTANYFMAGAQQAVSPQIFFTAQLTPSDGAVRTSAGIAIYDSESTAAAAKPDQYGVMRPGPPKLSVTLDTNALVDRRDTVQARYTSSKDGLVTIHLFNNGAIPVVFSLDQSGLMQQNHPLAPITLQLATGPTAATCQFILGFKSLHDLDPADIGDCTENQAFASNGDAQQHTTKGLMAWRKADNWTAFTNGYTTWINGPDGLVNRLNTDRFPWEAQ